MRELTSTSVFSEAVSRVIFLSTVLSALSPHNEETGVEETSPVTRDVAKHPAVHTLKD
jgi:hypothetical protein